MTLSCWMSWKGCGIAGRRVRPVRPGTRSSGRCDWREEDRVGVGGGDVVRRGAAEAGTGDLWVGSGGAIVGCGGTLISCDVGNAGGRDGAGGAGGNAGGDSGGGGFGGRRWGDGGWEFRRRRLGRASRGAKTRDLW